MLHGPAREKFHKGGEYTHGLRPSTRNDERGTMNGWRDSSFILHRLLESDMKKDTTISVLAVVVVAAVCFGLAAVRPPFQPTASKPFTYELGVAPQGTGRVVMRVNGEPVTENEFEAVFAQLPADVQQQFSSEPGKMAFAEQVIRIKLMEQEARRRGIDRDPKVAAQVTADRMNVLANAAAQKLVAPPTEDAVLKYYKENGGRFEAIDISHIAFAYEGGKLPPRGGGRPSSEAEAVNKALAAYKALKNGADFAAVARRESDDAESGQRGGELGHFTPGALPQELEARIWALKPGQFSGPIPSPLAVHIFLMNSRGTAPIDKVRAGITQRVQQQNMFDRVELLRRNAKVDFDPKFFPDAKSWHGAPPTRRPS
jgi:hypothetical protein